MNTTGSTNRKSVTFKMGLAEVLSLIFVTLKLTDFIDWSWWWVLSPLWITYGLVIIFAIFVATFGTTATKRISSRR